MSGRDDKDAALFGCGELMIELAPLDSPDSLRRGFAGDVFNTLYYARLLMPHGRLVFTRRLALTAYPMKAFIARTTSTVLTRRGLRGVAGLYMIHLRDGERSFSYWRNASAAARQLMREPDLLAVKLAAARFIYLSGITLAILSPADRQLLLKMVAQVRGADRTVFFDSNIRENLWPDAAEMRSIITAAGAVADIVLPSLDDEKRSFGDADAHAVATVVEVRVANSRLGMVCTCPAGGCG